MSPQNAKSKVGTGKYASDILPFVNPDSRSFDEQVAEMCEAYQQSLLERDAERAREEKVVGHIAHIRHLQAQRGHPDWVQETTPDKHYKEGQRRRGKGVMHGERNGVGSRGGQPHSGKGRQMAGPEAAASLKDLQQLPTVQMNIDEDYDRRLPEAARSLATTLGPPPTHPAAGPERRPRSAAAHPASAASLGTGAAAGGPVSPVYARAMAASPLHRASSRPQSSSGIARDTHSSYHYFRAGNGGPPSSPSGGGGGRPGSASNGGLGHHTGKAKSSGSLPNVKVDSSSSANHLFAAYDTAALQGSPLLERKSSSGSKKKRSERQKK